MSSIFGVSVSTQTFPTDGFGGGSAIRGSASAGGTTSYTLTTATDTAASWTLTGVTAGDYAFTADGFWGIVVSYAPAANNSVLTVDRWRKAFLTSPPPAFVPATGQACTVHSPCHLAGFGRCIIQKVAVMKTPANAETFAITDQKGTAISGLTWTFATGNLPNPGTLLDLGDDRTSGGFDLGAPFGAKYSATTGAFLITYKATERGP